MGIRFSQPNKDIFGKKNPNWRGGKIKRKCKCGSFFFVFPCKIKDSRGKYCSRKCSAKFVSSENARKIGKFNKGKRNGRFFSGRGWLITDGRYKMIFQPYHPFAQKRGYIAEHRLVMEKHLGRFLKPEEVVHHKNYDRMDNRIENLLLFRNQSEHSKSHLKT